MLGRSITLVALVLPLIAACAPARVDTASEASKLLAVDRAWGQSTGRGTEVDSLISFWTDDARVAMPGQPLVHGKAAIREMVKGSMSIPGFQISWVPDSAVVAESGELGYTFGKNSVTMPDAKGKVSTAIGRYITVWRKGADGRWRCVMDYANTGPA